MYAHPVFCTQCGKRLEERLVGAHHEKPVPVCASCGAVHWIDPKVAAGCLILRDGKVLLARRGIEPQQVWAERAASYPENRVLEPAEVAEVIAFLCSPRASGVNGQSITVALGGVW